MNGLKRLIETKQLKINLVETMVETANQISFYSGLVVTISSNKSFCVMVIGGSRIFTMEN
mgnify:CR=1 FL=1